MINMFSKLSIDIFIFGLQLFAISWTLAFNSFVTPIPLILPSSVTPRNILPPEELAKATISLSRLLNPSLNSTLYPSPSLIIMSSSFLFILRFISPVPQNSLRSSRQAQLPQHQDPAIPHEYRAVHPQNQNPHLLPQEPLPHS